MQQHQGHPAHPQPAQKQQVPGGHAMRDMHLVVLQHGLWGRPEDMQYVSQVVQQMMDVRRVLVLNSDVNTARLTYDGIDVLGDRLAKLVVRYCERLAAGGIRRVAKISFVAYSLGGLIARYAIGKLAAIGFLVHASTLPQSLTPHSTSAPGQPLQPGSSNPSSRQLISVPLADSSQTANNSHQQSSGPSRPPRPTQHVIPQLTSQPPSQSQKQRPGRSQAWGVIPVNFVSFASPHLGAWAPPTSLYRAAFNTVLPYTLSRTGSQLVMADCFLEGRPLLAVLADPAYAFHAGLAMFQKRLALANTRHDATVPFTTSSITQINPYESDAGEPINTRYPCVVRPALPSPAAALPPAPPTHPMHSGLHLTTTAPDGDDGGNLTGSSLTSLISHWAGRLLALDGTASTSDDATVVSGDDVAATSASQPPGTTQSDAPAQSEQPAAHQPPVSLNPPAHIQGAVTISAFADVRQEIDVQELGGSCLLMDGPSLDLITTAATTNDSLESRQHEHEAVLASAEAIVRGLGCDQLSSSVLVRPGAHDLTAEAPAPDDADTPPGPEVAQAAAVEPLAAQQTAAAAVEGAAVPALASASVDEVVQGREEVTDVVQVIPLTHADASSNLTGGSSNPSADSTAPANHVQQPGAAPYLGRAGYWGRLTGRHWGGAASHAAQQHPARASSSMAASAQQQRLGAGHRPGVAGGVAVHAGHQHHHQRHQPGMRDVGGRLARWGGSVLSARTHQHLAPVMPLAAPASGSGGLGDGSWWLEVLRALTVPRQHRDAVHRRQALIAKIKSSSRLALPWGTAGASGDSSDSTGAGCVDGAQSSSPVYALLAAAGGHRASATALSQRRHSEAARALPAPLHAAASDTAIVRRTWTPPNSQHLYRQLSAPTEKRSAGLPARTSSSPARRVIAPRSARMQGDVFVFMLPLLVVLWLCMLLWLMVLSARHYSLLLVVRRDTSWDAKWPAAAAATPSPRPASNVVATAADHGLPAQLIMGKQQTAATSDMDDCADNESAAPHTTITAISTSTRAQTVSSQMMKPVQADTGSSGPHLPPPEHPTRAESTPAPRGVTPHVTRHVTLPRVPGSEAAAEQPQAVEVDVTAHDVVSSAVGLRGGGGAGGIHVCVDASAGAGQQGQQGVVMMMMTIDCREPGLDLPPIITSPPAASPCTEMLQPGLTPPRAVQPALGASATSPSAAAAAGSSGQCAATSSSYADDAAVEAAGASSLDGTGPAEAVSEAGLSDDDDDDVEVRATVQEAEPTAGADKHLPGKSSRSVGTGGGVTQAVQQLANQVGIAGWRMLAELWEELLSSWGLQDLGSPAAESGSSPDGVTQGWLACSCRAVGLRLVRRVSKVLVPVLRAQGWLAQPLPTASTTLANTKPCKSTTQAYPQEALLSEMCERLNELRWHRVDIDTYHYHAHAAIVVRSATRFAASHGHIVEYAVRQMRDIT